MAVRADRRLKVLVNADYSLALPIAKARASQVSKAALENFDLKTPAATGPVAIQALTGSRGLASRAAIPESLDAGRLDKSVCLNSTCGLPNSAGAATLLVAGNRNDLSGDAATMNRKAERREGVCYVHQNIIFSANHYHFQTS